MNFKITEIQNQGNTQINVLVDIFRDNGNLLAQRVFILPDELFSKLTKEGLVDWVTTQVRVYKRALVKEKEFKDLINISYDI